MDEALALLRQLKYTETVLFKDQDPYAETPNDKSDLPSHADIEMILLDLL